MKKKNYYLSTLLAMLFVSVNLFSLNYTITFTGSGASTSVESVIVQNLTKKTTVTVPLGNVLNLTDVTAINEVNQDNKILIESNLYNTYQCVRIGWKKSYLQFNEFVSRGKFL